MPKTINSKQRVSEQLRLIFSHLIYPSLSIISSAQPPKSASFIPPPDFFGENRRFLGRDLCYLFSAKLPQQRLKQQQLLPAAHFSLESSPTTITTTTTTYPISTQVLWEVGRASKREEVREGERKGGREEGSRRRRTKERSKERERGGGGCRHNYVCLFV